MATLLLGTLTLTTLTVCTIGNATSFSDRVNNKMIYDYAVEVNVNKATTIPIKHWQELNYEQYKIVTQDDFTIRLSTFNTRLIYTEEGDTSAYDYARALVGEDREITVLSSELVDEKEKGLVLKP